MISRGQVNLALIVIKLTHKRAAQNSCIIRRRKYQVRVAVRGIRNEEVMGGKGKGKREPASDATQFVIFTLVKLELDSISLWLNLQRVCLSEFSATTDTESQWIRIWQNQAAIL